MTEAEALDLAARAYGWDNFADAAFFYGPDCTSAPQQIAGFRAHAKTIMENAALKAEIEALRALQEGDGELLTIAWMDGAHRSNKAHREQVAALEAKLAVAREALEEIADVGDDVDCSDCKASGVSARAALKEIEGD